MQTPPYRLFSPLSPIAAAIASTPLELSHGDATINDPVCDSGRARLADLDPHMHCSVVGTCLSTAELRKVVARFLFVRDCTDVEVHHEAVRLMRTVGQGSGFCDPSGDKTTPL